MLLRLCLGWSFLAVFLLPVQAGNYPIYQLRLRFEQNSGQAPGPARFVARAGNHEFLFSRDQMQVRTRAGKIAFLMRFAGTLGSADLEPESEQPTVVNEYRGSKALTAVRCWSRLNYRGVYPGIDVSFHGDQGSLEYDIVLAPGARLEQVRIGVSVAHPHLERSGDLRLALPDGYLVVHAPVSYQTINGTRHAVASSFRLQHGVLSFEAKGWERRYPLVIDPTLAFATYFGGSGEDGARAIAVDGSGNVYIAGGTTSGNLPVTASSFQSNYKANGNYYNGNSFVAKFNAGATAAQWVTYLGGTVADCATSIALDSSGNAYVAGFSASMDFPTTSGALQRTFGGSGGTNSFHPIGDAFVSKFDPNGKLIWSTYLGGAGDDAASAIALDRAGNIMIAGLTLSSNFPGVSGGYQKAYGGAGGQGTIAQTGYVDFDTGDAFVAKLDPNGAHLLAATYLGGSGDDEALAMTLDSSGNVWVAGGTGSSNFPVTGGAYQSQFAGKSDTNTQLIFASGDGFICELSSDLTQLLYSTYLGGSRDDAIAAIAADSAGAIYVAGGTQSSNFPITSGAYSTTYHGPSARIGQRPYLLGDAFVAKLQSGKLVYSTLLGGSDDDSATALLVDSQGNAIIAGMTNSSDFPVTASGLQAAFGGSGTNFGAGVGDGFIAQLNSSGSALLYSTFVGGSASDAILGLARDAAGNVYAAGMSSSLNFHTTSGVLQSALSGGGPANDAIVLRVSFGAATPAISAITNAASFATGGLVPGSLATIFGTNLVTATGIVGASSIPLPTTLAQVSVLINGVPAPLSSVANVNGQQQIDFEVPWELSTESSVNVQVSNNSVAGVGVAAPVLAAQPGIFTYGANLAAVLHGADYSLAGTASPAKPGETVLIYCTGLGAVASHPPTGSLEPGIDRTIANARVTIGGLPALIEYSGDAPGFIGLYQVNAVVPSGVAKGNQPVVISISGSTSNSALLPVQ